MTLIPEQSAFTVRGENTHTAQGQPAGIFLLDSQKNSLCPASRRVRRQSRRIRAL